jgi:hypothetical protein
MRYIIIFILLIQTYGLYSQTVKWYLPWENRKSHLIEDDISAVPLYINGTAYRILKVVSAPGNSIKNISIISDDIASEIFYLPTDQSGKMDVLIPYKPNISYNGENLFLIKFIGKKSGVKNVKLKIGFKRGTKEYLKKIKTSPINSYGNLNSNVWAYLGYNYLINGLNTSVVDDLYRHHINFIVIPGYAQPSLDINRNEIAKLDSYLKTLGNKFDYYCIYLSGYQDKKSSILSNSWKLKFPFWFQEIQKTFIKNNISPNKILLYPFDEPSDFNIKESSKFVKYLKSKNISVKTFITLHKLGSENLALEYDFVQVHIRNDELLKKVISLGKNPKMILNYETNVSSGNDNHPRRYLELPWKAIRYNLGGYGMWSYADVKKSDMTEFNNGKGSWEFTKSNRGDFNNSLIHRKVNTLYSSLRWEAFSAGQDEYYWMQKLVNGKLLNKKNTLINSLLDKKMSLKEWEKLKLSLDEN